MANLEEVVEWPSVEETRQRLKVSQNAAYGFVWSGKVAAIRVCGRWRVDPASIERLRLARLQRGKGHRDNDSR